MGLLSDEQPVRRRLTPAEQKDYVMRAGKCMACGEADIRVLEVHHIEAYADGGTNHVSNLSVLCPNCHRKAQKGLISPPSLGQRLTRKGNTRSSKSRAKTRAAKLTIYCQRCGEIPGAQTECIGLSISHNFSKAPGVVYCRRCGQEVGIKSECIGLSMSHDFVSGKRSDACSRCGVSVGRKTECTGLHTNHNFVST